MESQTDPDAYTVVGWGRAVTLDRNRLQILTRQNRRICNAHDGFS